MMHVIDKLAHPADLGSGYRVSAVLVFISESEGPSRDASWSPRKCEV